MFFGPEDPEVARAAIAAGARGLIRGGEREDLVASVAKALMLLLRGGQVAGAHGRAAAALRAGARRRRPPAADAGDAAASVPTRRAGPPANGPPSATAGHPASAGRRASAPTTPASRPWRVNALRRLALTERELQVLRGMADGKSNAEIGRELFVSEDTVKTHARRLFRKLSARDRAHAVAAAFRAGLVR